eukprot:comp22163_c0_seq1/m.52025 comp22163_c0_seq1/g.52025  ORF comp22163_c0_seq1/g.52025 comp22163_c0_seq1/m.52025 type:complete len:464 (+) comp22163_c0_seq1:199-1590(+)
MEWILLHEWCWSTVWALHESVAGRRRHHPRSRPVLCSSHVGVRGLAHWTLERAPCRRRKHARMTHRLAHRGGVLLLLPKSRESSVRNGTRLRQRLLRTQRRGLHRLSMRHIVRLSRWWSLRRLDIRRALRHWLAAKRLASGRLHMSADLDDVVCGRSARGAAVALGVHGDDFKIGARTVHHIRDWEEGLVAFKHKRRMRAGDDAEPAENRATFRDRAFIGVHRTQRLAAIGTHLLNQLERLDHWRHHCRRANGTRRDRNSRLSAFAVISHRKVVHTNVRLEIILSACVRRPRRLLDQLWRIVAAHPIPLEDTLAFNTSIIHNNRSQCATNFAAPNQLHRTERILGIAASVHELSDRRNRVPHSPIFTHGGEIHSQIVANITGRHTIPRRVRPMNRTRNRGITGRELEPLPLGIALLTTNVLNHRSQRVLLARRSKQGDRARTGRTRPNRLAGKHAHALATRKV